MRRKLPWILFALSLAANLFFVIGVGTTYVTERDLAKSPEQRIEFLADRLDLSEERRQDLRALRDALRQRWTGMRGGFRNRRAELMAEVARPDFDRERVLALLDRRAEQRRETLADTAEEVHAFLATLSPAQRQTLLDMARERGFLRTLFGWRGRGSKHREGNPILPRFGAGPELGRGTHKDRLDWALTSAPNVR